MQNNSVFKKLNHFKKKLHGKVSRIELPFDLSKIKAKLDLVAIKSQLIKIIQKAIENISNEQDRTAVVAWFISAKGILEKDIPKTDKAKQLYSTMDSVKAVRIFVSSLAETLKNYLNSSLPLPLKVAMPVTALAMLILGAEGVGIAAFGGAIGLPVVILFFIGSAGIAAVVDPFLNRDISAESKKSVAVAISILGALVLKNKLSKSLEAQLKKEALAPKKQNLAHGEEMLKHALQNMDPIDFERHVMSFFEDAGMKSSVTKASNDCGIDGWASHEKGLIVVQCKRNSDDNKVGRPTVQQFIGAIDNHRQKGNELFKGVIVTTSTFTREAMDSATLHEGIELIDINKLIVWHKGQFDIF